MQSRKFSMIESIVNVLAGYSIALLTQLILFPLMGLEVSMFQNLKIGLVFTVVSLIRSYILRRLFNRIKK